MKQKSDFLHFRFQLLAFCSTFPRRRLFVTTNPTELILLSFFHFVSFHFTFNAMLEFHTLLFPSASIMFLRREEKNSKFSHWIGRISIPSSILINFDWLPLNSRSRTRKTEVLWTQDSVVHFEKIHSTHRPIFLLLSQQKCSCHCIFDAQRKTSKSQTDFNFVALEVYEMKGKRLWEELK